MLNPILGSILSPILSPVLGGAIEYVARLDGATKCWQLSGEIPLPVGYSYEMDVLYEASNLSENDYLATGEGDTNSPLFFINREFLNTGSAGRLSTPSVDGGGNKLPYDGVFHTVSVTSINDSASVGILGARFDYTRNSSGIISMFRVRNPSGVVVNEIPLTNKAQGATQIATVGSVNATMINYTGDEWEARP